MGYHPYVFEKWIDAIAIGDHTEVIGVAKKLNFVGPHIIAKQSEWILAKNNPKRLNASYQSGKKSLCSTDDRHYPIFKNPRFKKDDHS